MPGYYIDVIDGRETMSIRDYTGAAGGGALPARLLVKSGIAAAASFCQMNVRSAWMGDKQSLPKDGLDNNGAALFSVFLGAGASTSTDVEDPYYNFTPCICPAVVLPLCDLVDVSAVVVRGTLLSRSDGTTSPVTSGISNSLISDPVVYTMDVTTFYKTDFPSGLPEELEFVTGGVECTVNLVVGEDYLLGLYWDSVENLRVASCGLARTWASVSEAELASCFDVFVCDTCGPFQECVEDGPWNDPFYYCADVCDPSPCSEGEVCTLQPTLCAVDVPCPPVAVCQDPCNGACDDTQECVQYAGNEKYYCSDTCEDACEEDETCRLRPRKWCRRTGVEGCPMRRRRGMWRRLD
eukprot:g13824.t1